VANATKVPGPLKWQPIPDFPGYEINNVGDVRNSAGRHLRPDVDRRGRRRFTLCRGGRVYRRIASRLVLLAFIGPCPVGMECCHNNGDATDNHVDNLRWDTHSANLLDRRGHGTAPRGERINTAKLTADEVREIRRVGYPLKPHAERYRISMTSVSLILRRKVWQHV
jgi:hypothetical protein